MMKNGIYFVVIALVAETYSRFWFMQMRELVTSQGGHKICCGGADSSSIQTNSTKWQSII